MTKYCYICKRQYDNPIFPMEMYKRIPLKRCRKCHKFVCSNCSTKKVEFNQTCLTDVIIRVCKNCKNK